MSPISRLITVCRASVLACCFVLVSCAPVPPQPISVFDWHAGQPFDLSRFRFEHGFVRNEELQYYLRGVGPNFEFGPDGLTFRALKRDTTNPTYLAGSTDWRTSRPIANYTSASIRSNQCILHGRVEVVAKIKGGAGAWPAIWFKGNNDHMYGEIDIMEHLGHEGQQIRTSYHYGKSHDLRLMQTRLYDVPALKTRFIKYEMDLSPKYVILTVDGKERMRIARLDQRYGDLAPLMQPFCLILNVALGGWAGQVDEAALPAEMTVQSIRISELPVQSRPRSTPLSYFIRAATLLK